MDYSSESTVDWRSQTQFMTNTINESQVQLQNEIIGQMTTQINDLKQMLTSLLNTEQDHYDVSKKIKKNVDNLQQKWKKIINLFKYYYW